MDLSGIRYWYDGLEPVDKLVLAGSLVLALVLLVPWRKEVNVDASVRPVAGELVPLLAPGAGFVKEGVKQQGEVLAAGDVVFTYTPQVDPVRYLAPVYAQSYDSSSSDPYQAHERSIRETYQRQMTDANGIINSCQDQLNRIFRGQGLNRGSGAAYEIQLAQNALARAREVPGELNRKLNQDLADLRSQRESDTRLRLPVPYQGAATTTAANGDVAVTVADRVYLWSITVRFGTRLAAGQECASLLPEGAAVEVQGVVRAALAKELRTGQMASLEVVNQAHDAELVGMRLEKIGNRDLDQDEVASLMPAAVPDGHYRLVTLTPLEPDARLFPPPAKCKLRMRGASRCLLQRILF
jgi:hypothetical protein